MRTGLRLMSLPLLMACVGGCSQATPHAPLDETVAAIPAAAPAPEPSTAVADSGLAIAVARESADRAVREQTLLVQKRLRDQDNAWKQARDAAQRNSNERCMAGQKMRRVANGWVQAGVC